MNENRQKIIDRGKIHGTLDILGYTICTMVPLQPSGVTLQNALGVRIDPEIF